MTQGQVTKVGWGAVITGEPQDLADWAFLLKQRFDPWIEMHDADTVLRSAWLDELGSASEVREQATAYIARLNSAMALSQNAKPVRLAGAIRFAPDGAMHKTDFPEALSLEIGRPAFGRPPLTVIGPDGQPIPPAPPEPSEVQHWAIIADEEYWLNEALIYFGRATNWFDAFKVLECLIERFGGRKEKEKNFLALKWAPKKRIQLLKRTANWAARHAGLKRPPKSMELPEARQLVGQLLRRALEEAAKKRR
jgi:hypothetical protein